MMKPRQLLKYVVSVQVANDGTSLIVTIEQLLANLPESFTAVEFLCKNLQYDSENAADLIAKTIKYNIDHPRERFIDTL